MNKLLLNTQIEALNLDHGREIVQFYKSYEFYTGDLVGICTRATSDSPRYYGLNRFGKFDNRNHYGDTDIRTITLEEAKELVEEKTLFTIEDLAEGKCALVNNGTSKELRKVLNAVSEGSADGYLGLSVYYWSKDQYYWNNGKTNTPNLPTQSVKDFLTQIKPIMKKEVSRFPVNLSQDNAKRILLLACPTWTDKLAKLWGKDMLLLTYTRITEDFYKEMRNACTSDQHLLFDEIFGKDVIDNSVDLSKLEIPNNNFLNVRANCEYKSKGFYLDSAYNWEIVTDSEELMVLVPTKK